MLVSDDGFGFSLSLRFFLSLDQPEPSWFNLCSLLFVVGANEEAITVYCALAVWFCLWRELVI